MPTIGEKCWLWKRDEENRFIFIHARKLCLSNWIQIQSDWIFSMVYIQSAMRQTRRETNNKISSFMFHLFWLFSFHTHRACARVYLVFRTFLFVVCKRAFCAILFAHLRYAHRNSPSIKLLQYNWHTHRCPYDWMPRMRVSHRKQSKCSQQRDIRANEHVYRYVCVFLYIFFFFAFHSCADCCFFSACFFYFFYFLFSSCVQCVCVFRYFSFRVSYNLNLLLVSTAATALTTAAALQLLLLLLLVILLCGVMCHTIIITIIHAHSFRSNI